MGPGSEEGVRLRLEVMALERRRENAGRSVALKDGEILMLSGKTECTCQPDRQRDGFTTWRLRLKESCRGYSLDIFTEVDSKHGVNGGYRVEISGEDLDVSGPNVRYGI